MLYRFHPFKLHRLVYYIDKNKRILSSTSYRTVCFQNHLFNNSRCHFHYEFNIYCSRRLSTKSTIFGLTRVNDIAFDINKQINQLQSQIKNRGIDIKEQTLATQLKADDIWNDSANANRIAREHASYRRLIDKIDELELQCKSAVEMAKLIDEDPDEDCETLFTECIKDLEKCLHGAEKLSIELLLDGPADSKACFIEITAGAGGLESFDFTQMLTQMYTKWAENIGYEASMVERNVCDEAGYRSATIRIDGHNAYGWVKAESGIHRMVRVSVYDSAHRRHTCFVKVSVLPVVENDDNKAVEINPADLRIDTFRSSGPGGQHVNTTESAVRITHHPSGLVVQCQDQKSQLKNRELAFAVLKSRLLKIKLEKEAAEKQKVFQSLGETTWGNQIRSYVLHPYKMVKDHRTNHETSQALAVLDGDPEYLTPFMEAHLIKTCGISK